MNDGCMQVLKTKSNKKNYFLFCNRLVIRKKYLNLHSEYTVF